MNLTDSDFLLLRKISRCKLGIDVKSLSRSTFEHALSARLDVLDISPAAYFDLIYTNEEEQNLFIQGLLISESWFFREEFSVSLALQSFHNRRPIRVLSVPCARGEELISTFILAKELTIAYDVDSFEGYDLSHNAIAQSKVFLYGSYSFRNSNHSRRDRFFKKQSSAYSFNEEYQKFIGTHQADILSPTWNPKQTSYDIILCRNFFIYLRPDRQRFVIDRLHNLLSDDGLLVMGASEAISIKKKSLSPLPELPCIFRKQHEPSKEYSVHIVKPRHSYTSRIASPINRFSRELKTTVIPDCRNNSVDGHSTINTLIGSGKLNEAFSLCLESLELNPYDDVIAVFIGIIYLIEDQESDAAIWFKRALVSNPNNLEASLYLHSLEDV